MKRYATTYIPGILASLIVVVTLVSASLNYWFNTTLTTLTLEEPVLTPTHNTNVPPKNTDVPPGEDEEQPAPLPLPSPTRGEILPAPIETPQYAPLNLLLIGSDKRSNPNSPITGERSDSTILVHIPAARTHAHMLSIPRDLWVNIPECRKGETVLPSKEGKFNESFARGGTSCAIKTVNEITGLPINNAIVVDFQGFKKIVNTIGGLTICLREPINDPNSKLTLPAGEQTINGQQALALARARYTLADGSDIARIDRQQKIIDTIIKQTLTNTNMGNPQEVYQLATAIIGMIAVDEAINTIPQFTALFSSFLPIPEKSIRYHTIPYQPYDGANLRIDEEKLKTLLKKITNPTPPVEASSKEPKEKNKKKNTLCPDGYIY